MRTLASCAVHMLLGLVLMFEELHRNRVETVAQPGRRRSVGKHVAEVRITSGAPDFRPHHAITAILDFPDMLRVEGLSEARPAGSALELLARSKQRQSAKSAGGNPSDLVVVQPGAAKGPRGTMVKNDLALFRREATGQFVASCVAQRPDIISGSR